MNFNPIPAIFNAAGKLFQASKGVKTSNLIIVSLLIVALFGIYTVGSIVVHHNPTPRTESERFTKSLVANRQIQSILDAGRGQANADRYIVRQFHNNQKDLTEAPFMFVKTTAASVRAGVSEPPLLYDDYPTSTVNELLIQLFQTRECVEVRVETMRDQALKRTMLELGTTLTLTCPIVSTMGYPLGYISLGYTDSDRERPDNDEIFAMEKRDAQRVADYLGSVSQTNHSLLDRVASAVTGR